MEAFLVYVLRSRRVGKLLAATVCIAFAAGCPEPPDPRPNVLIYVVDTLRRDSLGIHGNTGGATPHIDAIGRAGVVFDQATSPSSWTRPSIATLLTGLDPPRHGAVGRADALPREITTLGERLREHGYASAFVSSNPNVGSFFGFGRGFDEMLQLFQRRRPGIVSVDELLTRSEDVVGAALEWIDAAPRPFFLVVMSIDAHSPYTPPPEFDRFGGGESVEIDGSRASLQRSDLNDAQRRRIRNLYQGEVAYTDSWFGALVDGLRTRGALDDTLLLFTADHGEEFWERGIRGHGASLADTSIRIPLVVHHPRSPRVTAGVRRADPAGLDDIVPTVLDLLKLPADGTLAGRALFNQANPAPTFSSLSHDGHSLASARDHPWKLVWDLTSNTRSLYDLTSDPYERMPLSEPGSPGAAKAFDRLSAVIATELAERRSATDTPVGPLPDDVEATLRALGYLED